MLRSTSIGSSVNGPRVPGSLTIPTDPSCAILTCLVGRIVGLLSVCRPHGVRARLDGQGPGTRGPSITVRRSPVCSWVGAESIARPAIHVAKSDPLSERSAFATSRIGSTGRKICLRFHASTAILRSLEPMCSLGRR